MCKVTLMRWSMASMKDGHEASGVRPARMRGSGVM